MDKLDDLVVLITGATDGLGERVAGDLAARGATLVLHGRDPEKGRRVLEKIRKSSGNDRLLYCNADFASLAQVDAMARRVLAEIPRLDVLINNAGVGAGREAKLRELSADGHELRFAVNYLAHFLLTSRLLPLLRETAEKSGHARIVNVASAAQQSIDFSDVMLEKGYDGMRAYSQSKLAMIMHTFDLAGELEGSGVTANALHPASLMDTKMVWEWFGTARTTVEEGARYVEQLAVAGHVREVSGEYFDQGTLSHALEQAYDGKARRLLRELSQNLCRRWLTPVTAR